MKELLNSLSEMLDKKEVKSLNIFYEKTGEVENLSATVMKEDEEISIVSDGKTASSITVNIDSTAFKNDIEEIAKELSNISKRSDLR